MPSDRDEDDIDWFRPVWETEDEENLDPPPLPYRAPGRPSLILIIRS